MRVALITEVFHGTGSGPRLRERLEEARAGGAQLAVLPELPLDRWAPADRQRREADGEPPGGPRHAALAAAARAAGIAVLGGAIVEDPASGRRHNTALLMDARGALRAAYRKAHIPHEAGFWEASHYEPGDAPPEVVRGLPMAVGMQLCSDLNRPQGCQLLGALGAQVVLAPRCTPLASYPRWKLVMRANALTSCVYVVSVNRPGPEGGVPIGGPSVAVAPDAEMLLEGTEPLALVDLDPARLEATRRDYPGYLAVRSDLYAAGWRRHHERGE